MATPFLVPKASGAPGAVARPRANPVDVYLARLGPGSRRGMLQALDAIADFLSNGTLDANETDWASIRYQHTSAVRSWLVNRYASSTANTMMAALRGILKEVWRLGLMPHDEFARAVDMPPVRGQAEPRGRALTTGELQRLFDVCRADCTPAGVRDGAIIGVLFGIGLRRAEIVALDFADYDHSKGVIAISGKGNKPRLGYALEQVAALLNSWVRVRGAWDGAMFCPINKGGALMKTRFSPQGLALVIKKRASEAGVANVSCHDFRRSFATTMLSKGADIAIVQKLLGHASLTTTALYDKRGEAAKVQATRLLNLPLA